jgi:uncharacterized protein
MILLSPAKKLATTAPAWITKTSPEFWPESLKLLKGLQQCSIEDLRQMMHLSPSLATENHQRYKTFNQQDACAGIPALFGFYGDVYKALDAPTLSQEQCLWANDHLLILSGFYGWLKPFDALQAYRLEMGTKWCIKPWSDLYAFWQDRLTQALNQRIKQQNLPHMINLASNEYAKVIDRSQITIPIINVVFKEQRDDGLKTIGILAKKARGKMARYLIKQQNITDLAGLKNFNQGYAYAPQLSNETNLIFISQN